MREYLPRAAFESPVEGTLLGSVHPIPTDAQQILRHISGAWEVPVDDSRRRAELAAAERDFVEPLRALGVIR